MDDDNNTIDNDAEISVRQLGRDSNQASKVLDRLEAAGYSAPINELEVAGAYLGDNEAIEFFEKEDDLGSLRHRVLLVSYLHDRVRPLYTLDELANLTRSFIAHLKHNRNHLFMTGYPRSSFGKSLWLDFHLNKLYYVKQPLYEPMTIDKVFGGIDYEKSLCVYATEIEKDDTGNITYDYVWTKEELNPAEIKWQDGVAKLADRPLTICSYDDAAQIGELDPQDSERLKYLRPKVFTLKCIILKRLFDAAKEKNSDNLTRNCLKKISQLLSIDEAQFLLNMDYNIFSKLRAGGEEFSSTFSGGIKHHTGGLHDLVEIMGHFVKETRIGTMHKTRESLCEIEFDTDYSYYAVVGQPEMRIKVDDILNQFLSLDEEENEFFENYQQEVNEISEGLQFGEFDKIRTAKDFITIWGRDYVSKELYDMANTDLGIAHTIIKENKIKEKQESDLEKYKHFFRNKYVGSDDELRSLIDKTSFSSGKHNYSALGEELGCHRDTAKRLVAEKGLLDYWPPPRHH
jgi:hypothetical protein